MRKRWLMNVVGKKGKTQKSESPQNGLAASIDTSEDAPTAATTTIAQVNENLTAPAVKHELHNRDDATQTHSQTQLLKKPIEHLVRDPPLTSSPSSNGGTSSLASNGCSEPQVSPPSIGIQETTGLWDAAYDSLKTEHRKMVTWYEKILSLSIGDVPHSQIMSASSREPFQNRIIQADPEARQGQMRQLIDEWMSEVCRTPDTDAESGDTSRNASLLRDVINSIWQKSSQATLAWAGLCSMSQILLNPTPKTLKSCKSLIYLVSRMSWYASLPKLLTSDSNADRSVSVAGQHELKRRITNLYKSILLYEMKLVSSQHGTFFRDMPSDMFKPDAWDASLADIITEEASLATFDGDQVKAQLDEFIESSMKERQSSSLHGDLVISEESRKFLDNLQAIDPGDMILNLDPDQCQSMDDLCRWFTSKSDYSSFVDGRNIDNNNDNNQILWVSSGAGKGKTVLLTAIVRHLSERADAEPAPWLLAYFFCGSSRPGIETAAAVVKSLIWQLLVQQPSLIKHLARKFKSTGRKHFNNSHDFLAMSGLFYDILLDADLPRTYLVIDAVDECPVNGGWPAVDDLLNLVKETAATARNIKWIVSTNFTSHIRDVLTVGTQGCRHLDLNSNHEGILATLDKYVSYKVSEVAEAKQYEYDLETRIAEEMRQKSTGNFLWVNMVCRALSFEEKWYALDLLGELPSTLPLLYDYMLDKIRTLPRRDGEFCKEVLATMAIAHQPLHIVELASLTDIPRAVDTKTIVSKCSAFLVIRDNLVYFWHQSGREYIRQAVLSPDDVSPVHAKMARRCLGTMSNFLGEGFRRWADNNPITKGPSRQGPLNDYPRYSLTHWIRHVMEVKDIASDLETLGAITNFLQDRLLQWLGALVLTACLPVAVALIRKLGLLLSAQASLNSSNKLLNVLQDAHGLLHLHETGYSSAFPSPHNTLLFCPNESPTKSSYIAGLFPWVTQLPIMENRWKRDFLNLNGHADWIRTIAFSPDGRLIASGSDDRTVRVWDAETGTTQHTLEGHSDWVYSLSFASKGIIASGSDDYTVRLWFSGGGRSVITLLPKLPGKVMSLSFSPDDTKLAAVADKIVRIWDLSTNKHQDIEGHDDHVNCAAFSRDGLLLASGSDDKTVKIWNSTDFELIQTLESHTDQINSVVFSADSQRLVSCSDDSSTIVWDTRTWKILHKLNSGGHVYSTSFFPDGSRVVSSSDDDMIRIWDTQTGEQVDQLKGYGYSAKSVSVSPDGQYIASSANDCIVRFWYANDRFQNSERDTDHPTTSQARYGINAMAITPDGKHIASAAGDGEICLWDGETGRRLNGEIRLGHTSDINSLTFSPNGRILASASDDSTVRLWDLVDWKLLRTLEGHEDWVRCVTFSPDGTYIASGSDDASVRIWKVDSKETSIKLEGGHDDYCHCVAFSPNGEYLVSGGEDHRIVVWKTKSWEQLQKLDGAGGTVIGLAISPDSTQILSSTTNEHLKMWDLQTGKFLQSIETAENSGLGLGTLSFDPNHPEYVMTELGPRYLEKGGGTTFCQSPLGPPYALKYIKDEERWWITWRDRNVIALPEKYAPNRLEPASTCVLGYKIAIGCSSGQVLLFEFSKDIEPRV